MVKTPDGIYDEPRKLNRPRTGKETKPARRGEFLDEGGSYPEDLKKKNRAPDNSGYQNPDEDNGYEESGEYKEENGGYEVPVSAKEENPYARLRGNYNRHQEENEESIYEDIGDENSNEDPYYLEPVQQNLESSEYKEPEEIPYADLAENHQVYQEEPDYLEPRVLKLEGGKELTQEIEDTYASIAETLVPNLVSQGYDPEKASQYRQSVIRDIGERFLNIGSGIDDKTSLREGVGLKQVQQYFQGLDPKELSKNPLLNEFGGLVNGAKEEDSKYFSSVFNTFIVAHNQEFEPKEGETKEENQALSALRAQEAAASFVAFLKGENWGSFSENARSRLDQMTSSLASGTGQEGGQDSQIETQGQVQPQPQSQAQAQPQPQAQPQGQQDQASGRERSPETKKKDNQTTKEVAKASAMITAMVTLSVIGLGFLAILLAAAYLLYQATKEKADKDKLSQEARDRFAKKYAEKMKEEGDERSDEVLKKEAQEKAGEVFGKAEEMVRDMMPERTKTSDEKSKDQTPQDPASRAKEDLAQVKDGLKKAMKDLNQASEVSRGGASLKRTMSGLDAESSSDGVEDNIQQAQEQAGKEAERAFRQEQEDRAIAEAVLREEEFIKETQAAAQEPLQQAAQDGGEEFEEIRYDEPQFVEEPKVEQDRKVADQLEQTTQAQQEKGDEVSQEQEAGLSPRGAVEAVAEMVSPEEKQQDSQQPKPRQEEQQAGSWVKRMSERGSVKVRGADPKSEKGEENSVQR